MKTSSYFVIVSLFFLLSCKSKEEKLIQAEMDKIQGTWTIDNFSIPTNAPDTLKTFFQSGTLIFNGCKYDSKKVSGCSGNAQINDIIMDIVNSYLTSTNTFSWQFISAVNKQSYSKTMKAVLLFDGNWEIIVDGNKMTAKRKDVVKPYLPQESLYKGEVMFTATRK